MSYFPAMAQKMYLYRSRPELYGDSLQNRETSSGIGEGFLLLNSGKTSDL